MPEWRTVRLEDIAANEKSSITKPYGSAILKSDYVDSGVPVVRGVNLAQGRFHDDDFVFITEELADSMPGARLQPGDLVFTHRGSVGQVSMIPRRPKYERYQVSTSQVKARLDPAVALPEFYYYWFRSPSGRHSILQCASTVGVPGIAQPVATVRSLEVPLPSLTVQAGIAEILGAFDDKIESNQRIIELCPELVRAHVAAALNAGGGEVAVADLAEFVNGGAYTKGASGKGRMVIRIAELNSGPGSATVYNEIDVPDDKVARPGDILMSWSGSLGVYRWVRGEAIVNQHIFKVLPSDGYPAWLVFDRLDAIMPVFRGIAKDKATTMGHIQRGHLSSTLVDVPLPEAISRLDECIKPLWDRLLVAEQENLLLAVLRDTLLPELLSGRIRVSEAYAALAGVGA